MVLFILNFLSPLTQFAHKLDVIDGACWFYANRKYLSLLAYRSGLCPGSPSIHDLSKEPDSRSEFVHAESRRLHEKRASSTEIRLSTREMMILEVWGISLSSSWWGLHGDVLFLGSAGQFRRSVEPSLSLWGLIDDLIEMICGWLFSLGSRINSLSHEILIQIQHSFCFLFSKKIFILHDIFLYSWQKCGMWKSWNILGTFFFQNQLRLKQIITL